ncbi:hypothetical protein [Mycolicibacterium neoaurum]|uniref:hypothetical protein n=1 Tax=Mycolicibacterium neoaurum TaxID=1795 RepID=UPI0004BE2E94|nr:hypothetical protein [Mycolicibacterium neoaurum]
MAVADHRLVLNPVDGVELPAVGTVEQRFLTMDQLHAVADAAGRIGRWCTCWRRAGCASVTLVDN